MTRAERIAELSAACSGSGLNILQLAIQEQVAAKPDWRNMAQALRIDPNISRAIMWLWEKVPEMSIDLAINSGLFGGDGQFDE